MNRTTLQTRIIEEIVLRRGQVKERQWRQTGLPDEAARDGISAEEFRRLVNEVSRQLNFEKLADLRRRLEDALERDGAATPTRPGAPQYQLHQLEEDDFVAEGVRMGLSASFIEDRWIPQLIADLKKENTVTDPVQPPDSPTPPTVTPVPAVAPAPPVSVSQAETPGPAPLTEPSNRTDTTPGPSLRERVNVILDEYQGHISARDLRLLFRAMHTDERVLAEEILAYMSANFYASETEPQGATLPEKLLSTDWRHLAWWDTPAVAEPALTPEPAPTYTPPAPEPTPVYVPPVTAAPSQAVGPPPAPNASNAGLWGAVFAVAVLIILYLLIKPNQNKADKTETEPQPDRTEQPTETRPTKRKRQTESQREANTKEETRSRKTEESVASDEPTRVAKPIQTEENTNAEEAPKPPKKYDRLLESTGQFGEQQAKLGRKWGLWRDNNWMVYPIYDDITTFRDGRATVVRNGKTYEIDEKGNPVE